MIRRAMIAPQLRKKGGRRLSPSRPCMIRMAMSAPQLRKKRGGGEKTYPSEALHDPDGNECAPGKERWGEKTFTPQRPCTIWIATSVLQLRKKGGKTYPSETPA